jgi:hypothetical protein
LAKIYGERFVKPPRLPLQSAGFDTPACEYRSHRCVGRSMIVRQFLQWMRTAPAAERGDATSALARAYLYSDLGPDDRAATEGALIMLLDDPSPVVRAQLARALAFTEQAPPAVILGLAADQPEIASWVLEYSPLLLDTDLVDAVATGSPQNQIAIAKRSDLPRSVSAAIAEVGCAEAYLVLVENPGAAIATLSFDRIVARHGHLGAMREAMLQREHLPAATRQALVAKLSQTLADFCLLPRMAGAGSRSPRGPGRVRKGYRDFGSCCTGRGGSAPYSTSARERPAHRRIGFARPPLRQSRNVHRSACGAFGYAAYARERAGPRPGRLRLAGGVRAGGITGFDLSGFSRSDRSSARSRL